MSVKKVLVVDDSTTDLKNLQQIVSSAGYTVLTASSGEEAVNVAKNDHPDAVLMDVIMDGMNGFQACRAITSDDATKDISVVLVSSKGEKADRIWGEEQGASGYVTKPYTSEQILEQLQAL
ncbi:MAG: response regulator [Gammaproteobacteria bacterium]|nr:response regulator [Gammaproteobacteria bacterium]MDH5801615.1 response regulator [Gammaproteobacteria bacterium]